MATKFYRRANEAAQAILDAFERQDLPEVLASIFVHRDDNVPCRQWSWNNQLLAAIFGNGDARGYRQWQEVGRNVKKGEKSFSILVPCTRKVEVENDETGETTKRSVLYGFASAAVFGVHQTDGEPLQTEIDAEKERQWVDSLPVVEVARKWGLNVDTFNGEKTAYAGYYNRAGIALGVRNLATWAHELIHAADDRNRADVGGLKPGQRWDQEIVAELGGAILLEILGFERESDRGGCWQYVASYARKAEKEPMGACQSVLNRVCEAVSLVLSEAEAIQAGTTADARQGAELAAVA